jgi:nucleotide-binding universal stress UspA family protein
MYQHILLAVALQRWEEFSSHALAARNAAVALARGAGAKLSVLSVYEYEELEVSSLGPEELGRFRESQMQRIDTLMQQKMKTFLDDIATEELNITPLLKVGDARTLILRTADGLGVDLMVIGAHSKRSFLDVLLGGTAAYVGRHAFCPVIMVQPGPEEKRLTPITE